MENVEEHSDIVLPELLRFNKLEDVPEEYLGNSRSVELDGTIWICVDDPLYVPTEQDILEVSGLGVILINAGSTGDRDAPIVLPHVFPTGDEVYKMLLEAVRSCVLNNMLRPMQSILYPHIRDKCGLFNESIAFREVGLGGSLDLFSGKVPIQQFIGKVLHDDEVVSAFLSNPVNSIINERSMQNTRVSCGTTTDGDNRVSVTYKMPYSDLARRYISLTSASQTRIGDLMYISLDILYEDDNMDGLMSAARLLGPSLNIYFKLLTRFPSCHSYQINLPDFRTS